MSQSHNFITAPAPAKSFGSCSTTLVGAEFIQDSLNLSYNPITGCTPPFIFVRYPSWPLLSAYKFFPGTNSTKLTRTSRVPQSPCHSLPKSQLTSLQAVRLAVWTYNTVLSRSWCEILKTSAKWNKEFFRRLKTEVDESYPFREASWRERNR